MYWVGQKIPFFVSNEDLNISARTNLYWMMYVSFCLIILAQRLDRSRILFFQNVVFREKLLKMNFDGIQIWEIFFIKKILKRAKKIIIWWSKVRTIWREGAAKHPRKSQVVFCGCAKVCVTERCHGRLRSSCLPILGASAEWHLSNDRVARNIWRHE